MFQRSHHVGRAAGALALVVCGVLSEAPTTSAAGIGGTTSAFVLRHTAYAPAATATVKVTVLRTGMYRLRILAARLPTPETIRVAPARHAYLAWAFDGTSPHGTLRAVRLIFRRPTGDYSADGMVTIAHITELFITADKAGGSDAPTQPEVSVLSTVGHLHL